MTASDSDDDDRPWERPGAVRRDCEPHRGPLLLGLAWATVGASAVAFGLVVMAVMPPSYSGLVWLVLLAAAGGIVTLRPPLAFVARVLARRDIEKMRTGLMDPAGEHAAQLARSVALLGLALGLLVAAAAVATFALESGFWAVAVGGALLFEFAAVRT